MTRSVSGVLAHHRCAHCQALFPIFVLGGDTDMATDGLCTATSLEGDVVAVAEMTADEWNADEAGFALFERRLAGETGSRQWRVPRLLRIEPSLFRTRYRVIYACVRCPSGEARRKSELSVEAFQAAGGEIVLVGDLRLAETKSR